MESSRPASLPGTNVCIEELEDLYEHAPCGYLSLALGGQILRVNATFQAWSGYSKQDLLGRSFQGLLDFAGKIYYETHFAPLLRMQGFFNEVAFELVASDGSLIPVLVNAVEKRDPDGAPSHVRVTVFNATDRRRYECELLAARDALSNANQELRAFHEALPVGIFRADAAGRIIQASGRFCELFGVESASGWHRFVNADDLAAAEGSLQRAVGNGEPFSSRLRVARGDEAPRLVQIKAIPVSLAGQVAPKIVGVAEDVTEQVHTAARKRELSRYSAISQVTGGLAHHLNNLLQVIMGNLEILEEETGGIVALRQVLDNSQVATERAAALVSRLLVYSGYSTARHDLLDIDACLRDIAQEFGARHRPDHPIVCHLNAQGAVVELDAGMLKEAIGELIANAVSAMPSGGEVRLASQRVTEDAPGHSQQLVVAVCDNGIGMDEAMLAKAREPFYTARDIGQGVGLGLSLVDGVSRIAGGKLTLRSRPGAGTTAEMHLPIASRVGGAGFAVPAGGVSGNVRSPS